MSNDSTPAATSGNSVVWEPADIFYILSDATRWQVLVTLARSGPQPATVLQGALNRKFDAAMKHLVMMERAGVLVTTPDPVDKRRRLYGLSPALPLVKSATGMTMDFGFCLLRF